MDAESTVHQSESKQPESKQPESKQSESKHSESKQAVAGRSAAPTSDETVAEQLTERSQPSVADDETDPDASSEGDDDDGDKDTPVSSVSVQQNADTVDANSVPGKEPVHRASGGAVAGADTALGESGSADSAMDTSTANDKPDSSSDTVVTGSQDTGKGEKTASGDNTNGQPIAGSDDCYRYEGDTCIYTDPSSGVEYVYSADREGWLRRDGADDDNPQHAPTLENCFYIGEHYCFRDVYGQVYRLDPTSNCWEKWTPPPDAASIPLDSTTSTQADTRFQDASGAWCCRDASGATLRWCSETSRWLRPTGIRKRRLDRGSSDDSEHDSDEREDVTEESRQVPQADPDGPSDGTGYEWDPEKGAWFPKIDEEFLALHRLNYGFDAEGRPTETPPILTPAPPPPSADLEPESWQQKPGQATGDGDANKQKKRPTKKKPEWFQLEETKNTKVYVSGLPDDTTDAEFVELMSKCGLVAKDPHRRMAWKVKLYKDDYGVPKGDGVCTYIKIESVDLALSILDGSDFKGKKITVEQARFDLKGSFDPSKKPKKKTLKRKDREKLQKKQEKLFAWQPDRIRGERERHERVVVIKHFFSPEEFVSKPQLLIDYRADVREECSKFGTVKKVVLHDRHKDGVVEVVFEDAASADACVLKTNGRFFAGRRLEAQTWDGKTKYRVEETEEERAERLAKWDQFMAAGGDDASSDQTSSAGARVTSEGAAPGVGVMSAAEAGAMSAAEAGVMSTAEASVDRGGGGLSGQATPRSVSPEDGASPPPEADGSPEKGGDEQQRVAPDDAENGEG